MSELPSNIPPVPPRRVVSSAPGRVDLPVSASGAPAQPEAPARTPQEIEDRKGETQRVLKRLLAIIEDHRTSALRMGVKLEQLLDVVLRALEAETRREDPAPILEQGDAVRTYLATALYEELLEEPSNILFTTQVSEDTVRYEAMEAAFWAGCLAALRAKLIPAD
jgi:hypothetical protein